MVILLIQDAISVIPFGSNGDVETVIIIGLTKKSRFAVIAP